MASHSENIKVAVSNLNYFTAQTNGVMEGILEDVHQHLLEADALIAHLPESVLRNGTIMARSETLGHIEGARKGVTRIRQGLDKQFNRSG